MIRRDPTPTDLPYTTFIPLLTPPLNIRTHRIHPSSPPIAQQRLTYRIHHFSPSIHCQAWLIQLTHHSSPQLPVTHKMYSSHRHSSALLSAQRVTDSSMHSSTNHPRGSYSTHSSPKALANIINWLTSLTHRHQYREHQHQLIHQPWAPTLIPAPNPLTLLTNSHQPTSLPNPPTVLSNFTTKSPTNLTKTII